MTTTPSPSPTETATAAPTATATAPAPAVTGTSEPLDAATFTDGVHQITELLTVGIWVAGIVLFLLAIMAVMAVRK